MKGSDYIIVRDRREKYQFSIHNRVMDQWFPIIGLHGYALYSLYTRMANRKDERSFPGYTLISKHLGMGAATISNYNQLLVWCKLIHIDHGNQKKSNEYFVLNVPTCTPSVIAGIKEQALSDLDPESTFLKALLKRLDNWQPIQKHWKKHGRDKPIVVHPDQLTLFDDCPLEGTAGEGDEGGTFPGKVPTSLGEQGTSPGEVGTSPGEQGTSPGEQGTSPGKEEQSEITIQNNNPKEQSTTTTPVPIDKSQDISVVGVVGLLSSFGIQEPTLSQIANNDSDVATAQAWIWYACVQETLTDPTGFVISRLLKHVAPPSDLYDLALVVQQLSPEELEILHDRASERQRHGPKYVWWPLLFGEERNDRLAGLFADWETLELWYSHTYPGGDQKPTSSAGSSIMYKPPAVEPDPEVMVKQRKALAEHRARREREKAPPGGDTVVSGDLTAVQVWGTALDELALQMTEATHTTWLQDSRLARYEDDTFTIGVKNKYAEDWLENRLRTTVERTLARLAGRPIQIRFEARV